MGLHLDYELRLPADTPRVEVARMLGELRDFAATTQAAHVTPVADVSLDEPDESDRDLGLAWHCIRFFADILGQLHIDDDRPRYTSDPHSAIGFRVDPGEGSETATFALMLRHSETGRHAEWFWWCACKTQYASVHGDEHLIKVHTSMIAILDAAVRLGFDVTVSDETGFWETRSTEMLVAEVHRSNQIIARFAGAMSDAMGDKHDIKASIFEHPDFERLEMGE